MNLETVDDLANQIGDWIGCYGACKSESNEGCNDENLFCCQNDFKFVVHSVLVLTKQRYEMFRYNETLFWAGCCKKITANGTYCRW